MWPVWPAVSLRHWLYRSEGGRDGVGRGGQCRWIDVVINLGDFLHLATGSGWLMISTRSSIPAVSVR